MPELRKGIFLKGGQHPGRGVSLAGIYNSFPVLILDYDLFDLHDYCDRFKRHVKIKVLSRSPPFPFSPRSHSHSPSPSAAHSTSPPTPLQQWHLASKKHFWLERGEED